MKIWVDADACPKAIKDILFRVAERLSITTTLVANHTSQTPPSRHIQFLQVKSGFDVADNEIIKRLMVGDLVITSDIPLLMKYSVAAVMPSILAANFIRKTTSRSA